jgi:hypothetical protein
MCTVRFCLCVLYFLDWRTSKWFAATSQLSHLAKPTRGRRAMACWCLGKSCGQDVHDASFWTSGMNQRFLKSRLWNESWLQMWGPWDCDFSKSSFCCSKDVYGGQSKIVLRSALLAAARLAIYSLPHVLCSWEFPWGSLHFVFHFLCCVFLHVSACFCVFLHVSACFCMFLHISSCFCGTIVPLLQQAYRCKAILAIILYIYIYIYIYIIQTSILQIQKIAASLGASMCFSHRQWFIAESNAASTATQHFQFKHFQWKHLRTSHCKHFQLGCPISWMREPVGWGNPWDGDISRSAGSSSCVVCHFAYFRTRSN